MRDTFVVVTVKRWNIEAYKKVLPELNSFGDWTLITDREDLTTVLLERVKPKIIFFLHWSWLVPKDIYTKYNCVVFHPADLPNGRGGSVIQHFIYGGIYHTKVSALKVAQGIDTGDIYLKRDLCLNGSCEEIYMRLANIIFSDMIPKILSANITPTPQEGNMTLYKRRTPDMSKIDTFISLLQLHDFIRMLDADTYPPAFLEIGNFRMEFTRSALRTGYIQADVTIKEIRKK